MTDHINKDCNAAFYHLHNLGRIKKYLSRASLRWPNTVFARVFADAIQRARKDCKNKLVVNEAIILFIQNQHYLRYFSLLLSSVY